MRRTAWLQEHRMRKFTDVLSRYERRELSGMVGDVPPCLPGSLAIRLVERLSDRGGDHHMLAFLNMGERVPHPVDAASLPGRLEHAPDCGFQVSMGITGGRAAF